MNLHVCFISVDGEWGAWGSWSSCENPCGGSPVKRIRKCDNPAASNGGKPCPGPDSETKMDCTEPCEGKLISPFEGVSLLMKALYNE